jgi:uroporphyrinogen decarboxylase
MSLFLKALDGKPVERNPIWLMRQAGRYLPEYQELRKKFSLSSCFHEPELAKKATLMPLERFDLDAAIVFSDLLVMAEVWDKKVLYPEGGGLSIEPRILSSQELWVPTKEEVKHKLSYVFSTISLLKPSLSVPLIGFCGAPFTLLCYLLEGKSCSAFQTVRFWIEHKKEEFISLLDILAKTAVLFAVCQVESGVQAFQVFDSWANLLSKEEFALYALPYWKQIQDALRPLGIPTLFFSRANSRYPEEISSIDPSAISFDEGASMQVLRSKVPSSIAIQGNFSPKLLEGGSLSQIKQEALSMARALEGSFGVIWNLGHGVLPKTPIENVEVLLKTLRSC